MQRILALHSIFWPKENSLSKQFLLVLMGTLVISLAAQISIPLQPVPLTFQSVTVILLGLALGARISAYAMVTYFIAGALGLPIFANFSGGLHVFVGPTAGFLMAFLPAALVCGYLAQRGLTKSIIGSFLTGLLGTIIIFASGVSYLAHLTSWHQAILFGVMPFIISEPLKLAALSLIAPKFWK